MFTACDVSLAGPSHGLPGIDRVRSDRSECCHHPNGILKVTGQAHGVLTRKRDVASRTLQRVRHQPFAARRLALTGKGTTVLQIWGYLVSEERFRLLDT